MSVLLIYPGLVDGFGSYRSGSDWFNHGIGMISALLKRAGHRVRHLDCRQCRDWDEVRRRIATEPFAAALISVATVDFDAARKIAGIIREEMPAAKIIAGGPHPTLATEAMLPLNEFNCIFTHEAEITLPGLLDDLDRLPRLVKGVMPPDLDALPFVDRALAPTGETPALWGLKRPFFTITASRGCPYLCTFCQPAERIVFGNKVRKRSVGNILDELELLSRDYGMRSFMIHDDCFTQFPEWVREFCREKQRRGLSQPFVCQSRADIVCRHPELMATLAAAGLKWVLIGFESGSDRVLEFIKKGATVAENLEAARICRSIGIRIFANYMFGLPTETEDEMRQTVAMIRVIRPDLYAPAVFTPAPGSELYDYCRERGLILIDTAADYRRDVNSGAKIRGVDYTLVRRMVKESMRGGLMRRGRQALNLLENALYRSRHGL